MLEATILDLIARGIPEAFLFVLSAYTFSKIAIDKGPYVISSILYAVIIFIVRNLPINYGVHTVIGVITLIVLNISVNKFELIKAIKVSIFTFILEFICEGVDILIIIYVFGLDMNNAFRDNITKLLYSSPSLIIFAMFVFSYYFILLKRKELRVHK